MGVPYIPGTRYDVFFQNGVGQDGRQNMAFFAVVVPEKIMTLTNHENQKPTKIVTGIVL